MAVFVLDKKKHPLMPCSEKRARLLLERGRAVVVRLHPFTIRLKDRLGGETQPLRLQLDEADRGATRSLSDAKPPLSADMLEERMDVGLGKLRPSTQEQVAEFQQLRLAGAVGA